MIEIGLVIFLLILLSLGLFSLIFLGRKGRQEVIENIKLRGPLYSIVIDEKGNPFIEWHKTEQRILEQWQNDQKR